MQLAVTIVLVTKQKDPAAVSLGRKGGLKRVPKGFATMDGDKALEIRQAGAKAMWAKKRAGKKAVKKAGKKATAK